MITAERKDRVEELTESQKTFGKGDCFNINYLLCKISNWMVLKRNLRSLCFE